MPLNRGVNRAAHAQTNPKMKMTTPIPPSITAADSVKTCIGVLKFVDGFPEEAMSFCFLGLYASPIPL